MACPAHGTGPVVSSETSQWAAPELGQFGLRRRLRCAQPEGTKGEVTGVGRNSGNQGGPDPVPDLEKRHAHSTRFPGPDQFSLAHSLGSGNCVPLYGTLPIVCQGVCRRGRTDDGLSPAGLPLDDTQEM
jgi:hypothetical protein